MKAIIKVNRVNGRLLGASLFLSAEDIKPFLNPETNYLEVVKVPSEHGILLRITSTSDRGD